MIRVLEVFGEPISNGGQESFVFNVIDHMDTDGLSIDALTPYYCDNERYKRMIEDKGGSVVCLNLDFRPGKSRNNIYSSVYRYIQSQSYDVVHVHSGSISVLALTALAAKRCNVRKIIVHSHCAAEKETIKHIAIKSIMTPILNSCPTDYCACSYVAGLSKFSNLAMRRIVILNNGVDIEKFKFDKHARKKVRKKHSVKDSEYVIGHIGRFSYQKNQEFLIEVFVRMCRRRNDIKLLLVGSGEMLDKLRRVADNEMISDKVIFAGNVNDAEAYLSAMDVFVLPSRFEGLPIVGVEAQASGLQVITSTNVSKELRITENVSFLKLDEYKNWEESINNAFSKTRYDAGRQLREKGYDINSTSERIRKMYLECKKA